MHRVSIAALSLAASSLAACSGELREFGTIEGRVTRGPIMPVCREGVPCDGPYAGAAVVVYDERGSVLGSAVADEKGAYRVSVTAGRVVVTVDVSGPLPHCSRVPAKVTPRATAHVDIDCDTGIR